MTHAIDGRQATAAYVDTMSDTALLTAYARGLESERPDALFWDPYSRRLAGDRGEALAWKTGAVAAFCGALACRTRIFDELLMHHIENAHVDLVINLAAGLDTRPWRLALPGHLRWIDADLPRILEYKQSRMFNAVPRCAYEARAVDLTDPVATDGMLKSLVSSERALVVTEGLLVYLGEAQVKALARRLHEQAGVEWWITDLAGPRALAMLRQSWGHVLEDAPLRFAPANPTAFFGDCGWRETDYRSSQEEGRRLGRVASAQVLRRLLLKLTTARFREEIRRLSGVITLQRITP